MQAVFVTRWGALRSLVMVLLLASCTHAPVREQVPGAGARIARVWHGRTPNAKAEEYASYLGEGIKKFRTLPGNLGYQMMRETVGEETHFMVISYWQSREAIHGYAGEDIRKVRPLPRDDEFLIDPEQTVMNYDLAATDFGPSP